MTTFAGELRRAMASRGATRADLGRYTGACSTLAGKWMTGAAYPDHVTVVTLADHLDWPRLVSRSIEDRTSTCEECGAPTMTMRGTRLRRYCGSRCSRRAHDRKVNTYRKENTIGLLRAERDRLRAAVDAMCRTCEPEGLCRDDGCAIQEAGQSPWPFVPLNGLRREAA